MVGIILPGLDLNGKNPAPLLYDEVQLSPLLAVVVIGLQTVCDKLLRHNILIDRTEVDVLIALDNPHLDAVGILGCQ